MKEIIYDFEIKWENVSYTGTVKVEENATDKEIESAIEDDILSHVYWSRSNWLWYIVRLMICAAHILQGGYCTLENAEEECDEFYELEEKEE